MYHTDIQTKLDLISAKLSTDNEYLTKFFSDFCFCKEELGFIGSERELSNFYNQLCDAYKHLCASSTKFETFQMNWEKNRYKQTGRGDTDYSRLVLTIALGVTIFTGALIIFLRSRRK
jgi:hypothetical protein